MRRLILFTLAGVAFLTLTCGKQTVSPTISEKLQPVAQSIPPEVETLISKCAPSDEEIFQSQLLPTNIAPPDLLDTTWDIYAVTFLWGHLFNLGDSNAAITTDWSGYMSINGVSVIAPVKAIDFEAGQDSILQEEDSAYAAWVSTVCGDFDGITCLLYLKRGIVYFTAPWLTFAAQPITLSFNFGQLENLTAFYRLDSINGLAVHARRIWPRHCAEGSLIGKWIKANNTGDSGYFNGEWLDENGDISGVVAGYFRIDENGLRVFEGWISHPILDVIIGRMCGAWFYDDPRMCPLCGAGYGRFKGLFKFTDKPLFGMVEGEFFEHSIGSMDMTLKGRWNQFCLFSNDLTSDGAY